MASCPMVSWCEIPVSDFDKSIEFYCHVFDYVMELDSYGQEPFVLCLPLTAGVRGSILSSRITWRPRLSAARPGGRSSVRSKGQYRRGVSSMHSISTEMASASLSRAQTDIKKEPALCLGRFSKFCTAKLGAFVHRQVPGPDPGQSRCVVEKFKDQGRRYSCI